MRPQLHEAHSFYWRYIDLVEGDDLNMALTNSKENGLTFLQSIPEERWDFAYEEGKWTLKEVYLHIIDTERVMAYRAMRISRNDSTPLQGFDQDTYVPYYRADQRSIASIQDEYLSLRESSIQLFRNLDEEQLSYVGNASGWEVTARGLGFIIAGHEIHHLNIVRDRYLG